MPSATRAQARLLSRERLANLCTVIETDRLLLRVPAARDADAVARAMADEEVVRFIGLGESSTFAESLAHVESMRRAWSEDGFGAFIVVRKADAVTTKIGEHRETAVTTYLGVSTELWTF